MDMTERPAGDATVLELSGKLTPGTPTQNLHDKINSLLHQQRTRIVLDLGGLKSMDSGRLGELVRSHSSAQMKDGRVLVANIPKRIHDLLVLTRLHTVFDVHDSVDAAVKSLSS